MKPSTTRTAAHAATHAATHAAPHAVPPAVSKALFTGFVVAACSLVLLSLPACSTPPAAVERHFDLGNPPALAAAPIPTAPAKPATPPDAAPRHNMPLVVPEIGTPADLDSDQIAYRQTYLNAFERRSYSASHWTAPPAQLLGRMLRAALAAEGPVLSERTPSVDTVLQFDLVRFEQVFDQAATGHALLQLRATLTRNGTVVAQHDFQAQAPCPSPDAAGAAAALATASLAATAEVVDWLAQQR